MRLSGHAVMDSQKSKQCHDLEEESVRFDHSNTLVRLYSLPLYDCE